MLKKLMAVMMVMGIVLTGGMANAVAIDFGPSKVLTDKAGAKYEVAGENLMIIILGGKESKKTPAKDGDYTFTDGSKLTVKGGKIVKDKNIKDIRIPQKSIDPSGYKPETGAAGR